MTLLRRVSACQDDNQTVTDRLNRVRDKTVMIEVFAFHVDNQMVLEYLTWNSMIQGFGIDPSNLKLEKGQTQYKYHLADDRRVNIRKFIEEQNCKFQGLCQLDSCHLTLLFLFLFLLSLDNTNLSRPQIDGLKLWWCC